VHDYKEWSNESGISPIRMPMGIQREGDSSSFEQQMVICNKDPKEMLKNATQKLRKAHKRRASM
jgi:hypothetical protein